MELLQTTGCDPDNCETPCANRHGPLHPQNIIFVAPNGALFAVAQHEPGGPPYIPRKVSRIMTLTGSRWSSRAAERLK